MTAINRHKNVPAGVRLAAQASVQIVARKICHFIFGPLPHIYQRCRAKKATGREPSYPDDAEKECSKIPTSPPCAD